MEKAEEFAEAEKKHAELEAREAALKRHLHKTKIMEEAKKRAAATKEAARKDGVDIKGVDRTKRKPLAADEKEIWTSVVENTRIQTWRRWVDCSRFEAMLCWE